MSPAVAPMRSAAFDLLRVAAAALVLLSHARCLLFRDAADQPALHVAGRAFFAVSGFGHQAVILFFVLSGALVTSSMMRMAAGGYWSLRRFAMARLARLWIVLVPCLLGGAVLDTLGLMVSGPGQAYGIPSLAHVAPPPALQPAVLVGNLLFLQTIVVPVFGSNGPLWSLANEAWYYALAALLFAAWRERRRPEHALPCAMAAVVIGLLLPRSMVALAPVWACGAAVALLRGTTGIGGGSRRVLGCAAGLLVLALLAQSRLRFGLDPVSGDLALGCTAATLLFCCPEGTDSGMAAPLARGCYSLYLSHVPVLALFAAATVGPGRLPFGCVAMLLLVAALVVAVAVAAAIWWGFERHTDSLRAWLHLRLRETHVRSRDREALP